ncbi:MAG: hypothetical protein KDI44_00220 [Thiothrix sp.]|nr:hypothetical protein [Thiothrix sp.]HPQ95387.1 hypothetical protein [Thiolinea sp.]
MYNLKWTDEEKQLARSLFDNCHQAELEHMMAELKQRAASINTPEDMWALLNDLNQRQREIQYKYGDYRYSQLILLFGRLVREGHLKMEQLENLSEDKLVYIRRIVE